MEAHWYGSPEVSGSSPGSVKFSLPIFKNSLKVPSQFFHVCLIVSLFVLFSREPVLDKLLTGSPNINVFTFINVNVYSINLLISK